MDNPTVAAPLIFRKDLREIDVSTSCHLVGVFLKSVSGAVAVMGGVATGLTAMLVHI